MDFSSASSDVDVKPLASFLMPNPQTLAQRNMRDRESTQSFNPLNPLHMRQTFSLNPHRIRSEHFTFWIYRKSVCSSSLCVQFIYRHMRKNPVKNSVLQVWHYSLSQGCQNWPPNKNLAQLETKSDIPNSGTDFANGKNINVDKSKLLGFRDCHNTLVFG